MFSVPRDRPLGLENHRVVAPLPRGPSLHPRALPAVDPAESLTPAAGRGVPPSDVTASGDEVAPVARSGAFRRRAGVKAILVLIAAGAAWFLWDGLREALAQSNKTQCITNERRISSALLLYCQDHDGRLPPPEYEVSPGRWRHWFGLLQSYLPPDEKLVCPRLDIQGVRERTHGYEFPASYALNGRFFDTFSAGPFPLEDLELPAQTAMLVESAGFRDASSGDVNARWILSVYHDTAGLGGAYPSPHESRMNVAAADGHIVTLKLAHYKPEEHDREFGRLGGSIYNWNGGHPNGDTGGPPRE